MPNEWRVAVGAEETSAIFEPATADPSRGLFVMAHGAGGSIGDRSILAAAKLFRSIGLDVVRFNFLYKEKGKGGPDRMPVLEETFKAVVQHAREKTGTKRVYIGGRSMGGRAGSMIASTGFECDGLILLAYPLHAPGKQDQLRDAHLPLISQPVICFNGTRDTFMNPEIMQRVLKGLGDNWTMHWLEGAEGNSRLVDRIAVRGWRGMSALPIMLHDVVVRLVLPLATRRTLRPGYAPRAVPLPARGD